ncbi:MAG: polysaccharide deacetylase family protein [Rhodospirillales bacterium]
MKPNERIPYQPIVERAPLTLPGGARVVIWPLVTVEVWDSTAPLPRTVLSPPGGQSFVPDVPNWTWAEYGMRVGFWRLKKILDEFDIRATLSLNGAVCEAYSQVVQAALESRWEPMAHSYLQKPMHSLVDERAAIRKSVKIIREHTGIQPRGWMGPGLTQTDDTPEYLVEAGIEYVTDWVLDDQPCRIATDKGPLYTIPYSVEINDVAFAAIQHRPSSEIYTRAMDQFDCLYEEGETNARVMAIAVHPYLSGVPHRIKYFRRLIETLSQKPGVVFWTGGEILDWYKTVVPAD